MTHISTPWTVNEDSAKGEYGSIVIMSPWTKENIFATFFNDYRGARICSMDYSTVFAPREQAKANADYIVKCVNSHDELISACSSLLCYGAAFDIFRDEVGRAVLEKAQQSLKKAGAA